MPVFEFEDASLARRAALVLVRMPPLAGPPVRILRVPGLRDPRGPVHGGSFLRERRMAFDCTAAEFPRIFAHELYHFVWLRAGNPLRRSFEEVLSRERRAGARGELGWSAEWRKSALRPDDFALRTRRWREYVCESFCDTAAWLYSRGAHPEFTLAERYRRSRRRWFQTRLEGRPLSI